jgi:hypothetical protein
VRQVKDPMSGFFALPRELTKIFKEYWGYKILLEILVKTREFRLRNSLYIY